MGGWGGWGAEGGREDERTHEGDKGERKKENRERTTEPEALKLIRPLKIIRFLSSNKKGVGETQNSDQVLLQGRCKPRLRVGQGAAGRDSKLRRVLLQGAIAGRCRRVLPLLQGNSAGRNLELRGVLISASTC